MFGSSCAKKIIALLLVVFMVAALAACGKKTEQEQTAEDEGFIFQSKDSSTTLGTPDKTVDPESIYKNLTYNTKMFYGRYSYKDWFKDTGKNETIDKFRSETSYITDPFDKDIKISAVPVMYEAGYKSIESGIVNEKKYDWITLTFLKESGSTKEHTFKYEVEGNKLVLTGVDFEWDNATKKLEYKLFDDVKMEFGFEFQGLQLTLTNSDASVVLNSNLSYNGAENYLCSTSYVSSESKSVDDIFQFAFQWKEGGDPWFTVNYEYENENGTLDKGSTSDGILQIKENGLFTCTVPYKSGEKTYQFACFLCGDDGLILTDGETEYYYQADYYEYYKKDFSANVDISELDTVDELSESELKAVEQKKTDLYDALETAFKDAGINVNVNKKTGELAMDTTVLFGGDSAELTAEGKAFLDKFIKAYTGIIYDPKYDGFISKTIVEGHIAPVDGATYESGMPLSVERAENVKNYCLSKDTGVDTSKLAKTIETVGYSNSKPVKDKDGNVDIEASRRVSFKFIINLKNG